MRERRNIENKIIIKMIEYEYKEDRRNRIRKKVKMNRSIKFTYL